MFKKILVSAAALSAMAITASQAEAHGYGYGHPHFYASYNSYSYQPSCYVEQRPATIRVWDDYACEYVLRTVYRNYQVCN